MTLALHCESISFVRTHLLFLSMLPASIILKSEKKKFLGSYCHIDTYYQKRGQNCLYLSVSFVLVINLYFYELGFSRLFSISKIRLRPTTDLNYISRGVVWFGLISLEMKNAWKLFHGCNSILRCFNIHLKDLSKKRPKKRFICVFSSCLQEFYVKKTRKRQDTLKKESWVLKRG